MNEPLVSVIIPIYNAESYIVDCINSIIAQDYRNIEIIAVDDGSADRSYELCRSMSGNGNIRVFHRENAGVSAARNFGIELSTGELITFVDADDYIEPHHISALVAALRDGFDCTMCGYSLDYSNRNDVRAFAGLDDMDMRQAVLNMLDPRLYQGFLCNKLFRKEIIDRNHLRLREDIFYCEDLLFCAEYLRSCHRICCVEQATYHYRQHSGSAVNQSGFSAARANRLMTGITAIRECAKLYSDYPEISLLASARVGTECARLYGKAYCGGADSSVTGRILREARSHKRAVMKSPLSLREKVKFFSVCILPKTAAKLWNARETRYL